MQQTEHYKNVFFIPLLTTFAMKSIYPFLLSDVLFCLKGTTKMQSIITSKYKQGQEKLRGIIANAHHITVGLDIWTKKSYSAAYLCVSACFYNPTSGTGQHDFWTYIRLSIHTQVYLFHSMPRVINWLHFLKICNAVLQSIQLFACQKIIGYVYAQCWINLSDWT